MCNTSNNNLSFKERVQYYISKKEEIETEYKSRMETLNKEASADIIANCPIKVGYIYSIEVNSGYNKFKQQYYKVAKLEAKVDGTVFVYGYKRRLDKTWGKRDNIFIFIVSIYNNYSTGHYTKVEDYVEPVKD